MIALLSLGLVLFGSCTGAAGMLFLKQAAGVFSVRQIWRSGRFWLGVGISLFSMVLYLLALQAEALNVVYPLVSTTYLWTTLFAVWFLGERLQTRSIVGLAGIILGVVLVTVG